VSPRLVARLRNAAIDAWLGVRTRGVAPTSIEDGCQCATLDYASIGRVLDELGTSEDDVIVDVGCGRGRVVCALAQRRVREVVGVEGDPEIARECAENVERMRRRGRVRAGAVGVVAALADSAEVDDVWRRATALYLFAPFGAATLRRVLAAVRRSAAGPVRLVYVNSLDETPMLETGWRRTGGWPEGRGPGREHPVSFWSL
jgi:cyclopropane fatty-acyl-phospholipid synthase-like methyltransferase